MIRRETRSVTAVLHPNDSTAYEMETLPLALCYPYLCTDTGNSLFRAESL